MKILQLNLAKKLLIVDYESKEYFNTAWNTYKAHYFPETSLDNAGKTFICKALLNGVNMTEEDYRSLIADEDGGISISKHPLAYKISYSRHKNAFVDLIEKEGFYWLENPLGDTEPEIVEDLGVGTIDLAYENQQWKEAESRTLKFPIIFEILE